MNVVQDDAGAEIMPSPFMLIAAAEKSPVQQRDVGGPSEWTKIRSGRAISENCSSDRVVGQHHAILLSLSARVVVLSPLLDLNRAWPRILTSGRCCSSL